MRRLAQFVRLRASRVSRASRVCVHLSRVRLASACICLACVSRLSASVHVKGSECVRLASASVSRLSASRVCVCLASACICLACVSRLRAFVSRASRVCLRLFTSRVPNACVCVCVCLASVSRLSRVGRLVSRRSSCLASVSRRSSCLASVCLLVNACGDWLILCVGRHSKSSKGFCYRHTIAVHIDYVDYMNRPLIF